MSDSLVQERAFVHQTLMRVAREYFELRLAHLYRARPTMRGVLDDMNHQLVVNLSRTLEGSKAYGPDRVHITTIVMSDDWTRRRALLNPTDQNTLINEVIEKPDEGKTKTAAVAPIAALRVLFGRYDSSLERIVETLQTFMWIDIPDTIDYSVIDITSGYLTQILKARGIPDPIRESYNRQMNRPAGDAVELEDALLVYYHRLKMNLESFIMRRREEPVFAMVIKRELSQAMQDEVHQLIMMCAGHLHNAHQLAQGSLSGEQAQAYGRALGVPPDQVTAERAAGYEASLLAEKRKTLADRMSAVNAGGVAQDFKALQLAEARKRFETFTQHLSAAGVDLQKAPPKPRAEK